MAQLLAQEIVLLSKSQILDNMTFWPQMLNYQDLKKHPISMENVIMYTQ
jgi:hypothetical protein